mgnify:CR=1 FL=1
MNAREVGQSPDEIFDVVDEQDQVDRFRREPGVVDPAQHRFDVVDPFPSESITEDPEHLRLDVGRVDRSG